MKIVYLSHLAQTMTGGPKYSVPKQVKSQSQYDDVYWINMSPITGLDKSICETITSIDSIFNRINEIKPDLIVFEEVYYFKYIRIYKILLKKNIKYVIIPRGCLTKYAQKRKRLKKFIANFIFFKRFCKNAAAIEFLTDGEYESTGNNWNKNHLIIPNGIDKKENVKKNFSYPEPLKGIFIGRIEIIQKGIDVFLDACIKIKKQLIEKKVVFSFYGPIRKKDFDVCMKKIAKNGLENNIVFCGEIYGVDKEKALLDSDFFFLTSRFEGLPMGILDSISYGLPVLVTRQTNMGNVINDNKAGFSSDCNSEGVKNSILHFLELSKNDFSILSENALELSKRYIWNEIAQYSHLKYIELVERKEF